MNEKIQMIKQMVVDITADTMRLKRIDALQRRVVRLEHILKTVNTPWLLDKLEESNSRLQAAKDELRRLPTMDPGEYATKLYTIRAHLRGRIHIRVSNIYKIEGDLLDFQAKLIEKWFQEEDQLEKYSWYKPKFPSGFREMVRDLMKQPLPLRSEAA